MLKYDTSHVVHSRIGLIEIARLDIDGRIWAVDCNQLKITI